MDTWFAESLGLVAGTLTTLSYLPQVIQTYKSRSVKDISLKMYVLLALGVAMWIVYGAAMDSISVILANTVSLGLTVAILVMKLVFTQRPAKIHRHPPGPFHKGR
jgi:MtN3 and saliva related transmembrane protein